MPYKDPAKRRANDLKNKERIAERDRKYREENKDRLADYRESRKAVKSEYDRKRRERERDGFFSVYYLPEEHYVGMTNAFKKRMQTHKHKGKNTEGARILRTFESVFDAHIYETQWHKLGANGFPHKYK